MALMVLVALVLIQAVVIGALLAARARGARVEAALRTSEQRFRSIADRAPVMVWTTRPDTTLDYVNATCMDFTGLPLDQLLGEGWLNAVHPDDRAHCAGIYFPAFGTRTPFRMEYRIRRADGVYRWVLDVAVPRFGADGVYAGYVGATMDIHERRESEHALRQSQERLTMATDAGAVGIWDWKFSANELVVEPGLKALLGFADADISNRPDDWGSRVHPEDVPLAAARIQACVDGQSDVYDVEHRMYHKDGSVRWFLSRGSAVRGQDGSLVRLVGTKVDITARKQAEQVIRENEAALQESYREIQHLAGSLITAQDAERTRVARDLHDGVSQQVAALSIALSGLKRHAAAGGDAELQTGLVSIQRRVSVMAESIRDLSHDLHPEMLRHSGLIPALADHCGMLARSGALEVTNACEGDFESLDGQTALCLYRVAQEALHNVVKHASARRVAVHLVRTAHIAELTVSDDGKGFDVAATRRDRKGLGLVSINERVRLAGGTLSVVTEENKGTQIRVRLPVSDSDAGGAETPSRLAVI